MLDIKYVINNKQEVTKRLNTRNKDFTAEINTMITLYENFAKLSSEESSVREQLNQISKEISRNPSDDLKLKAATVSKKAKEITESAKKADEEYKKIAMTIPNLPSLNTPIGKDEDENVVIADFGAVTSKNNRPHWDILEEKHLMLFDEEKYISGARHNIFGEKLSQLIYAVVQYMMDVHKANEYIQIEVPMIVNEVALYNTGQLPKFRDDLYSVGEGQYLIPTAEVPLTNLAAGKVYKEDQLPVKMFGYTGCFRKEAGSAGRDTRGLIRMHQFRKVELVAFSKKADNKIMLNELLSEASKILDGLELPYRHLHLCTGDIGFSSSETIDIEVYMPGMGRYLEISSVSSMSDFQARRMNAKVNVDGEKEIIYTYNGSALAIERTIAAIIENYYDIDSETIKIPSVLQKYLDFDKI